VILTGSGRESAGGRLPLEIAVWLGLVIALATGGYARAGTGDEALIVQLETLAQGALDPILVFSHGRTISTTPFTVEGGVLGYPDSQLILFDLETGDAEPVEDSALGLQLVSPTEHPTTLGEIFTELGVAVLFETRQPTMSADPENTEAFHVYWPNRGPAVYFPDLAGMVAPPVICGDVTLDYEISQADVDLIRGSLADPFGSPLSSEANDRCSVIGPFGACDLADVVVLSRELVPLGPGIAPVCSAVGP